MKPFLDKIIIDNCFCCQYSCFIPNYNKWICSLNEDPEMDVNQDLINRKEIDMMSLEIPSFCERGEEYIDPEEFLSNYEIEKIPSDLNIILDLIFNAPSDFFSTLHGFIRMKSKGRKERLNDKKIKCHFCKKTIKDKQQFYTGRIHDDYGGTIIFCNKCKEEKELNESNFIERYTKQNIFLNLRKYGLSCRSIYQSFDQLTELVQIF